MVLDSYLREQCLSQQVVVADPSAPIEHADPVTLPGGKGQTVGKSHGCIMGHQIAPTLQGRFVSHAQGPTALEQSYKAGPLSLVHRQYLSHIPAPYLGMAFRIGPPLRNVAPLWRNEQISQPPRHWYEQGWCDLSEELLEFDQAVSLRLQGGHGTSHELVEPTQSWQVSHGKLLV